MNKNIIITGGSKGIGTEMVKEFASKGNRVIFTYNTSENQAKDLEYNLKDKGFNVEAYKVDISNIFELKKFAEYSINNMKKIDVLINNAGIDQFKLFTDITENDWNDIINTNLKSAVFLTKEISKIMINQKSGCIINISSIWGITGGSCEVLYSISKARFRWLYKITS